MRTVKYSGGKSNRMEALAPMVRSLASPEPSYIGSRIRYSPPSVSPRRGVRLVPVIVIALVFGSASALAAITLELTGNEGLNASITGVNIMPITLVTQHKDTHSICVAGSPCPGIAPDFPHAWDHVAGTDGIFGTSDDCPHCSAYSAPAAISMVAVAYGRTGQYAQQDRIYDNGKSVSPEITGDNEIQTHGVGMFDGTGGQPEEVQDGLKWALGVTLGVNEHSSSNPITASILEQYASTSRPVLWIDHGGWPVNMSSSYPANRADQGHAKVIGGYDDNNTITTDDDFVLVFDPWSEYNKSAIVPVNATLGPGGTYDPYWLPLRDVNVSDTADIFFVPSVSIPEFGTVIVPVVGMLLIAAVVHRARSRRDAA